MSEAKSRRLKLTLSGPTEPLSARWSPGKRPLAPHMLTIFNWVASATFAQPFKRIVDADRIVRPGWSEAALSAYDRRSTQTPSFLKSRMWGEGRAFLKSRIRQRAALSITRSVPEVPYTVPRHGVGMNGARPSEACLKEVGAA